MADRKRLDNDFKHHTPKNESVADKHMTIRSNCRYLADVFNELCPEGREKALAFTKLEEAMMWANAAIARNQGD